MGVASSYLDECRVTEAIAAVCGEGKVKAMEAEIVGSSTLMFIDSSALWVGPTWEDVRPTLSPHRVLTAMFSVLLLKQLALATELKSTAFCQHTAWYIISYGVSH
jgi:hypothetical protein